MADEKEIAVKVKALYKDFRVPHNQTRSVKDFFIHPKLLKKKTFEEYHVLKNIDFEVKRGEFFGIVGRNGSGKSTLLKILGGIYQPTKGSVQINGTLTPFIELGIGFNPELSGRENIYLNAAILGLTKKETDDKYNEIVEFAELEKFMDQKLKNYSSGMQVRLAFSIAMQAHNDILLIDEVLAVGDANFQRKCFDVFKNMKATGKTVVFVSHDMGAIREYCDKAILIENGSIVSSGNPDEVANDYIQLFNEQAKRNDQSKRWGDFGCEISRININDSKNTIRISYHVHANIEVSEPIFGLIIKNLDNIHVFDSNTKWKKLKTGKIGKGKKIIIYWDIPNVFRDGKYKITVAAAHSDGFAFYDWQEDAMEFVITRPEVTAGLLVLEDHIKLEVE